MTFDRIVETLRLRWVSLAAAVAIGVALGSTIFLLVPFTYTSTIQLYVSSQVGTGSQAAYQGAQLSSDRVRSYTDLITSYRVLEQASRQLGSRKSAEDLRRDVSATSSVDSVVINVSASDHSPTQAADIANSIGSVFPPIVDEIETPSNPGAQSPIAVRVVAPAVPSSVPSSASLFRSSVTGGVGGLFLGAIAVLAIARWDTRVRNEATLTAAAGVPSLGKIMRSDSVAAERQASDTDQPLMDDVRRIRVNLQFMAVDLDPRVLVVTSSTAGEGKSTSVCLLAAALGQAGAEVLVIEGDLRRPSVSARCGVDQAVGLTTVLTGAIRLSEATYSLRRRGFHLLPAGALPPNPSELLASEQMQALLSEARERFDYVLIDTPPAIAVTDAEGASSLADGVLLLCKYSTTSRNLVKRTVRQLTLGGTVKLIGCVLTMTPRRAGYVYGSYQMKHNQSDAPVAAR